MIGVMLSEQPESNTSASRKQQLSLKLSAPQLLDDQLKMLSPKTPFIHPEYPSIQIPGRLLKLSIDIE